jgi:adenosine kinase
VSASAVPEGTVLATGSVAFDYILTFNGRFRDHIMPDQVHILNLSFLVDRFERRRGGVAANYAYTLALLGQPSAILATAGADAAEYREWLKGLGVECSGLKLLPGETTATGFTTTDLDDNQITGYYGGAMNRAAEVGLADTEAKPAAVIVGPNGPAGMKRLVQECREAGIPFVYDPAHQLPHMSKEDLEEGCRGAWILIGNDYELELIRQRTGREVEQLLELASMVVTTLGREGSRIESAEGRVEIPPAAARREVDPTGAGDAYRAGLVAALLRGLPPATAGRIASLASAYVVEQGGTIEHRYTMAEFAERYRSTFGVALPVAFAAS